MKTPEYMEKVLDKIYETINQKHESEFRKLDSKHIKKVSGYFFIDSVYSHETITDGTCIAYEITSSDEELRIYLAYNRILGLPSPGMTDVMDFYISHWQYEHPLWKYLIDPDFEYGRTSLESGFVSFSKTPKVVVNAPPLREYILRSTCIDFIELKLSTNL